jgi:D-lactate dehydrogenase
MNLHYFSAENWERDYVTARLPEAEIVFHDGSIGSDTTNDDKAEALSVFVDSRVGEAELARFPNLRLIVTRSTGFDHIDLAACKARGIAVSNVPSYGEQTVAEFAFALILALSRRVVDADERVRQTGTFSQHNLRGFDLSGKTLGVVGCGHIGVHAIRIGNGFGMRVLGFDTRRDETFAAQHHFSYASLDELLAHSDVITLHIPYNRHTHHLINAQNIMRVKKGAYLINTARGAVVETSALIAALQTGVLAGAGLDVLEEEGAMNATEELALLAGPHPAEHALKMALENRFLIDHPRVIVTPHIAFDTEEAVRRIADTTIENLRAFAASTLLNVVNS